MLPAVLRNLFKKRRVKKLISKRISVSCEDIAHWPSHMKNDIGMGHVEPSRDYKIHPDARRCLERPKDFL